VTRLAFVGRGVEHARWTLTRPARGVVPAFFEARDGSAPLRAFVPDVVVAFDAAAPPPGADGAVTAALLTGEQPAPQGFDRVLATDPDHAARIGAWRSPPLPVDDALFLPADRPPARKPQALFLGPSSAHREELLVHPKHVYDLTHYAFGLAGDRLRAALARASVGVVLHEHAGARGFRPELALHLAAGHLVVAERMEPTRGLEPGLDHLVVTAPHELMRVLDQLAVRPRAWEPVRARGRFKAEAFRASRAWPRLLDDLAADLRAFGRAA